MIQKKAENQKKVNNQFFGGPAPTKRHNLDITVRGYYTKMLLISLILVHIVVVAIFCVLFTFNLIKIPGPFLAVVFWVPVFGPICALVIHAYFVSGRAGAKYTQLENMKASLVPQDDEPSRVEESVNDIPLEREDTLDIISAKLGITDLSFDNKVVDYFDPVDDFMLGSSDVPFSLEDYFNSSMQVNVDEESEVFATCGTTPLIWRRKYGEGCFVVCNFGYCEKAYRGIYSSAYSLLDDVCIYPVINGAVFYLDDFPSPVPNGDGKYIPS